MTLTSGDMKVLRELAEQYSDIAHLDVQRQRMGRYADSNDLHVVRPVVLIDEVPWGEIGDSALTNICAPELQWLEARLRRALYQWDRFQVDMVVPPVFKVQKETVSTGIGIEVRDTQIRGDTGAYISAHAYVDQLQTEDDLNRLRLPEITYNRELTEANLAIAQQVFDGLMEVGLQGRTLGSSIWDRIAEYRGVDSLLLDLAMRPEFMHQTARRFMEIDAAVFKQMEELELLDHDQTLLHCTPACTNDLPADDFDGKARAADVWGRCMAQIFGSVSPQMHDEFDLAYNAELFSGCGLLYYGCCEPLHGKIDILRKRFPKNLRKISVTPWANPERAAANIGPDYVLAAKPNPAFVAGAVFHPEPVEREIARYCEACRGSGSPLEFVLKDISTIANNPENLSQWAGTVRRVIDRYY